MSYEHIKYEVSDRILTITLNRPKKLNAFTGIMQRELIEAFDRADEDDEVRAVIVTGAGRGFCAGADLSSGGDTFDSQQRRAVTIDEHRDGGGLVTLRIYESKKPVIAAINGPAVGIGATMTLPMDIRIASGTAKMGFVFARRGITPEACSGWFLPRVVGISQALEWVMTGRVFTYFGRACAADDVADARGRSPDGGPQDRFEVYLLYGQIARQLRGCELVP